jgi:hypothetical protein
VITIATVLRSGGEYEPRHVVALRDMCRRFAPMHRFICMTDKPNALPLETIELLHDWPGWWSKMEIFRLRGPVLYLDLDTVIVRDISPVIELAGDDEFVILRDFYRGRMNKAAMQSSMMLWSGDMSRLYRAFREDPRFYLGGDQEWLEQHLDIAPAYWQDICPRSISSFKANPRSASERIIIFHGHPRPWEQDEVKYAAA